MKGEKLNKKNGFVPAPSSTCLGIWGPHKNRLLHSFYNDTGCAFVVPDQAGEQVLFFEVRVAKARLGLWEILINK